MRFSNILMCRLPLNIIEDSADPYDLGYRHAKRHPDRPPTSNDPEYLRGWKSYKMRKHRHGAETKPFAPGQHPTGQKDPETEMGGPPETGAMSSDPARTTELATGGGPEGINVSKLVRGPASSPENPTDLGNPESHGKFVRLPPTSDREGRNRLARSLMRSADLAKHQLEQTGHKLGKRFGCGVNGCVHASDTPGVIYKLDKGENEARLANMTMKDPGLQQLSALPKYHGVYETGITDEYSGLPIYAIKREDLEDLPEDKNTNNFFGWVRNIFNETSQKAWNTRMSKEEMQNEVDENIKAINTMLGQSNIDETVKSQIPHAFEAMRELAKRGLVPCDLHAGNWGFRTKEDGSKEMAMRDVGCYGISEDRQTGSKEAPVEKVPSTAPSRLPLKSIQPPSSVGSELGLAKRAFPSKFPGQ